MASAAHGSAGHVCGPSCQHGGGHEHNHSTLGMLLIGAGIVTAAVIAAPYLAFSLDSLGALSHNAGTDLMMAEGQINALCGDAIVEWHYTPEQEAELECITDTTEYMAYHAKNVDSTIVGYASSGWAGKAANMVSNIPLIGEYASSSGMANAAVSGTIGLGGAIIGHYLNKNDDGTSSIRWGNLIKTASLVTSLLVASPLIFTGISMGITVIGHMAGYGAEVLPLAEKFGSASVATKTGVLGGMSVIGTHLATCGIPVASTAASTFGFAPVATTAASTLAFKGDNKNIRNSPKSSFATRETTRREMPLTGQYPALF